MFTLFKSLFSSREKKEPTDIYERIEYNLKELSNEVINAYKVKKAMAIRMTMSSSGPRELGNWLTESSRIVDTQEYVPESWKNALRVEGEIILDDFMTHNGYVIDMAQWMNQNKPKIVRLLKGFSVLDIDDREYFQRNYTSVLRDVDTLLTSVAKACKEG
jgi:hypothetical protein